jgi:hypothetical protein
MCIIFVTVRFIGYFSISVCGILRVFGAIGMLRL